MHAALISRRLTSWIATLALLMAALVSGWSAPGVGGQVHGWAEVCSADGARWVSAEDGPDHGGRDTAHCNDCTLHTPVLDLPMQALPHVVPVGLAHAMPRAWLAARRTLHAWASAQPRAPPVLS